MGNHHGEPRGIKDAPRRGSGGERTESANCAGGADVLILHHPAPPVKLLSAHLRRLAAAERARQAGDFDRYCFLRKRGLKHQIIACLLEEDE